MADAARSTSGHRTPGQAGRRQTRPCADQRRQHDARVVRHGFATQPLRHGVDVDLGRTRDTGLFGHRQKTAQDDALASFQRSLVTPGARFDRYLNGQRDAISSEEEHGYQLFKSYGCIACHQGVNVGGNLLQKFGIFYDPYMLRGTRVTDADLGRFAMTGIESDRLVFRVPSLRNVAVTAPYLHDGSAASLPEAVTIMARVQLGRDLPDRDRDPIVKFLGTLTGEYQGRSLAAEMDQSTR
jgi:cytochrome c peroxidase